MKTQTAAISTSGPTHDDIRELAYKLWLLADSPSGNDLTFWLHAEQQLLTSLLKQESGPSATDERRRSSEIETAPVKSKATNSPKPAIKDPAVSPVRETTMASPFPRSAKAC